MRNVRVIAAIVLAIASTSAHGANRGATGYDNRTASGHDEGDDDTAVSDPAFGRAAGSHAVVASPGAAGTAPDQNIALDAVESGEAMPLTDIAKRVRTLFSARVLDARLIESASRLIYRLTILTDAGVSKRVDLDAKAGTVVRPR